MEQITYEDYIGTTIMMPDSNNNLNAFYKVIELTNDEFILKQLKCDTKLIRKLMDEDCNITGGIYEAKISNEYARDISKTISKQSITEYSIIYVPIVQYEV